MTTAHHPFDALPSVPSWKRALNRLDSSARRLVTDESDEAFMGRLYRDLLLRPADDDALRAGTTKLGLGLIRRGHVDRDIASSAEFRGVSIARECYLELLGRDPTGAETGRALRLLAAGGDRDALQREIRRGIDYRLVHEGTPETDRSLAASLPKEVWLELTTRCNIVPACVMCGYASGEPPLPRRDMDPGTWRSLLPLLRQARSIGLHGAGEPLLYPHLDDLLAALQPSPAVVGFNSNGQLLNAAASRRLVDRGLGWISFSLDAATADTYLRVRRRADFDTLLSKIEGLRRLRDAAGATKPRIEINMTLMKLNLDEAPAFVELAARLGLDGVMFQEIQPGGSQRVVSPDGFVFDYAEQQLLDDPRRNERLARARERARELGIAYAGELLYGSPGPADDAPAPEAPRLDAPPSPRPVCAEPWERLLFNVRGEAFVCCIHLANHVVLGQAPADPVERIWNGKSVRLVREAMFLETDPPSCRGCYRTSLTAARSPTLP